MMAPALFVLLPPALLAPAAAPPARGVEVSYEKDVRPIFRKHCTSCHNSDRARGNLDLSTYAATLSGSTSGKAVIAGKPEASPVYTLAAHLESPTMPPGKAKIPEAQLEVIRRWIAGGLVEKPAGKVVAAAQKDDGPAGLVPATTWARATPVTALASSPRAPLAAVSGQRQALVYDLASRKLLGAVPFPEGEVHALRFSPDGSLLVVAGGVGGQSGKVVGYDVKTWKQKFEIADEVDSVLAVDVSRDNATVVLGGPGRVVKVIDVASGEMRHAFRKPTDWVTAVGFSPDGLLVAAGDRFGGLFVWEARSGKEFLTLRGHGKGITSLSWRGDGDVLASASEDGTVRLWDLHKGEEAIRWDAHRDGATAVGFLATQRLMTAGRDGMVKLWEPTGKGVTTFGPMADHVLKATLSSDGKTVLAGDWAGDVRLYPVAGGEGERLALPIAAKSPALAVVLPPTPVPPPAPAPRAEVEAARRDVKQAAEELQTAQAAGAAVAKLVQARSAALEQANERLRLLEGDAKPAGGKDRGAALKAATEALELLKRAAALDPDNAALGKAVAEAERAVAELTGRTSR